MELRRIYTFIYIPRYSELRRFFLFGSPGKEMHGREEDVSLDAFYVI